MLSFSDGVHVRGTSLHMDARRSRPRGLVTHAHADHVGRHECRVSTPATARLCARRWGDASFETHAFGAPWEEGQARVTFLPAGHILGSAMALVEVRGQRILYTGDFRLRPSVTAEPCRLVPADILVMECTFGAPRYRFPPREQVMDQIERFARECMRRREVPILLAYSLGKAQEAGRLLSERGLDVALHGLAYELTRTYRELGVDLRGCRSLAGGLGSETVVILPPHLRRSRLLKRFPRRRTAYLSGWAMDASVRRRFGVDAAFALSDHADFDELLECVRHVGPRQVFTLHGPDGFSDHLRARGVHAQPARVGAQLHLL